MRVQKYDNVFNHARKIALIFFDIVVNIGNILILI